MKNIALIIIALLALSACEEKAKPFPKPAPEPAIGQSSINGTLKVDVNPASGKYNVLKADGTKLNANPFVGSQTFTDVPQSSYTVVFLPIDGYDAPLTAENVIVAPGATATVSHTYKSQLSPVDGILKVTVTPETCKFDVLLADGSKIENSPFTGSKELVLPQSTYTIRFLPLEGNSVTSQGQTFLVAPGTTTVVKGTCTK